MKIFLGSIESIIDNGMAYRRDDSTGLWPWKNVSRVWWVVAVTSGRYGSFRAFSDSGVNTSYRLCRDEWNDFQDKRDESSRIDAGWAIARQQHHKTNTPQ